MKRHAFTLIELLVVIAIIAILIALSGSRSAEGARGRGADAMREQSQADRAGDAAILRRDQGQILPAPSVRRRRDRQRWAEQFLCGDLLGR